MRKLLRYIVLGVVLVSLGSIIYGFVVKSDAPQLANRCIGFGTVGLFLLAMPLFLFTESKGKKMKDYVLSEENIRKMRKNESKTSENQ